MLKISEFFKKIRNKHTKGLFLRSIIQSTIKKHTNVDLPTESILLKSNSILLNGISQTARSQIFIKKQAIIQDINLSQDTQKIDDVR